MSRKLTQSEFVKRASAKHSNKYDYSKSIYVNYDTKIIITCPQHGDFLQAAGKHLCGDGCPKCGGSVRLTTKEFIKRSIQKHGNRFSYKNSVYVNQKTKIEIICKIHGSFWQAPHSHMSGATCLKCSDEERKFTKRKTNDEFIADAINRHGDKYTYPKTVYVSSHDYVVVTCKKHGDFKINANSLIMGCGCKFCAIEENSNNLRSNIDEFKEKAKLIHGHAYDYSECIYTDCKTKMKIRCKKHDHFFYQDANHHLSRGGCPICRIENTGWTRSKFINHCRRTGKAKLYVIKCFSNGEDFFKVGITSRTLNRRFSKFSKKTSGTYIPYDFNSVFEVDADAEKVWDLEKEIHRKLKPFKYMPRKKFGGYTECFSNISKEVEEILKGFNNA